jgi:hypothetical protein
VQEYELLRVVRLHDCSEVGRIDSKREHAFQVRSPRKTWTLAGSTAAATDAWLSALQAEHSRFVPDGSAADLDAL